MQKVKSDSTMAALLSADLCARIATALLMKTYMDAQGKNISLSVLSVQQTGLVINNQGFFKNQPLNTDDINFLNNIALGAKAQFAAYGIEVNFDFPNGTWSYKAKE